MSKYKLIDDQFKDKWINKPNNMGDVGDLQDITDELNNLLHERDEALNESLEQARLLGISGEWGCRVIAERDEAKAIAKEAINGLYNLGDYDLANRLSSKLEETK